MLKDDVFWDVDGGDGVYVGASGQPSDAAMGRDVCGLWAGLRLWVFVA